MSAHQIIVVELQVFDVSGSLLGPVKGDWLKGAKWSRRETPADPFQEG